MMRLLAIYEMVSDLGVYVRIAGRHGRIDRMYIQDSLSDRLKELDAFHPSATYISWSKEIKRIAGGVALTESLKERILGDAPEDSKMKSVLADLKDVDLGEYVIACESIMWVDLIDILHRLRYHDSVDSFEDDEETEEDEVARNLVLESVGEEGAIVFKVALRYMQDAIAITMLLLHIEQIIDSSTEAL